MNIYVKNMVCQRCVMAVSDIMKEHNIESEVAMGLVSTKEELSPGQLAELSDRLEKLGFEILPDKERQAIEQIKVIIREKISDLNLSEMTQNWSDYISDKLGIEYKSASRIFASLEGITIEHYIISQRIEKAKELVIYHENSLAEIAHMLGYSSVAHLSGQFKKITGMTPGQFRKEGPAMRKPLDKA